MLQGGHRREMAQHLTRQLNQRQRDLAEAGPEPFRGRRRLEPA